ncbi:MAG: DUF4340 domain-containing protein [bacterium]|nr:DUF4340 domain-containing protein [bacterium]
MKQFRSTIVIFILFVGFIGYYFLVEKKKPDTAEEKKIYIFNVNKDDINTLELTDMSDKSSFQLKKDKDWKMVKPIEISASKNTIDGIISELAKLSANRDVTEEVQNFKKYGLSIPKYKIKFSIGNEYHTLLIGEKNPTEEFYFVKEEDKNNIFTVNTASIDKMIKKSLSDLRGKEFLRIAEEKIKKIEITIKNKGNYAIEKNKENTWIVANSAEKGLDHDIQNVIEELGNISVEEFIDGSSRDLKEYGLDDPLQKIKIYMDQGEPVDLNFGEIKNNLVYTMGNKDKKILKVRRNIIDSIENLYINMNGKK